MITTYIIVAIPSTADIYMTAQNLVIYNSASYDVLYN